MKKKFGGFIGANITPSITSAKGVWDLRDQIEYNRASTWPTSKRILTMKLWGASGGAAYQGGCGVSSNGMAGGYVNVTGTVPTQFTIGNTLYIYVGAGGITNSSSNPSSGGFGGGGASYSGGADGGGASYVFLNGPQGSGTLLAVAGAGGGGSNAGVGGGSTGGSGGTSGGGTQSGGGGAGTDGFGGGGSSASGGSYLQGGTGMSCKGCGGGGGYYGGGGGQGDCGACTNASSGGGSSYINGSYFNTVYNDQGQSNNTVSTNASSDPDWNGSAGNGSGVVTGTNGYIVIYLNNTKYTFSYTGAVQTLSF